VRQQDFRLPPGTLQLAEKPDMFGNRAAFRRRRTTFLR
jgi:hypothetical protein